MFTTFHNMIFKICCEEAEPIWYKGGYIHPIYKAKGAYDDPTSYRGVVLLDVFGKKFHAWLRSRLVPKSSRATWWTTMRTNADWSTPFEDSWSGSPVTSTELGSESLLMCGQLFITCYGSSSSYVEPLDWILPRFWTQRTSTWMHCSPSSYTAVGRTRMTFPLPFAVLLMMSIDTHGFSKLVPLLDRIGLWRPSEVPGLDLQLQMLVSTS